MTFILWIESQNDNELLPVKTMRSLVIFCSCGQVPLYQQGKRTVMEYLQSPVLKVGAEAARER